MSRLRLILISALIMPGLIHAADEPQKEQPPPPDVCDIRPDLCDTPIEDEEPVRPRKKRRSPASVSKPKRKKQYRPDFAKRSKKCRKSNRPDQLDLPLCGSEAARAADDVLNDLIAEDPHFGARKKVVRRRVSAEDRFAERSTRPSGRLNFDSYLNSNASHPALSKRGNNQVAFQDTSPRAVWTNGNAPVTPQGDTPESGTRDGAAPAAAPPSTSSGK